jgi:hypothetical protein
VNLHIVSLSFHGETGADPGELHMKSQSHWIKCGLLAMSAMFGWAVIPLNAQENKAQPDTISELGFTPAHLADRATHRRAVEAVIWGMPAVFNRERLHQSLGYATPWDVYRGKVIVPGPDARG